MNILLSTIVHVPLTVIVVVVIGVNKSFMGTTCCRFQWAVVLLVAGIFINYVLRHGTIFRWGNHHFPTHKW